MQKSISTYSKIPTSSNIKIEPFDVGKRYTKPHRHNKYLELVYFSKGSGYHYIDQTQYVIEPPIIFVVGKEEVHHWELDTVPEGFVIILKERFLDATLDKHINLQLQRLVDHQMIKLDSDPVIDGLFRIASEEIKKGPQESSIVIEGVLKALLSKILSFVYTKGKPSASQIATRFNELLERQLRNDVSYYANRLHCTPQNLNVICKREYSKTASEYLADHIIKEAKRLLYYTDLTVTQISQVFNFSDVSHFVKYFKRYEAKTPLQFRKSTSLP
ncbi:helix-turn-helix domain-containing protein [Arenibacter certesii]|uniref:Transcriptional regulator n=1 Tax=Arenibacter certesii TaxID=228955 RepID=A0A918IWP2_9FLAO|nr:helix-turn-helix transcriptional regulator [Arenibacter certesii]GGW35807.1 transcriptional regulator [Arenibacter certesii]